MRGRTFSKVLPRTPFQKITPKKEEGSHIYAHIFLDKCRKIWYHTNTCGRVRTHSATLRSYACGRGGIGRRIRFRILRLSVCRFKSCRPHQKGAPSLGHLFWSGGLGLKLRRPSLLPFLLALSRRGRMPFLLRKMLGVADKAFFRRAGQRPAKWGKVLSPAPGGSAATQSRRPCPHPSLPAPDGIVRHHRLPFIGAPFLVWRFGLEAPPLTTSLLSVLYRCGGEECRFCRAKCSALPTRHSSGVQGNALLSGAKSCRPHQKRSIPPRAVCSFLLVWMIGSQDIHRVFVFAPRRHDGKAYVEHFA